MPVASLCKAACHLTGRNSTRPIRPSAICCAKWDFNICSDNARKSSTAKVSPTYIHNTCLVWTSSIHIHNAGKSLLHELSSIHIHNAGKSLLHELSIHIHNAGKSLLYELPSIHIHNAGESLLYELSWIYITHGKLSWALFVIHIVSILWTRVSWLSHLWVFQVENRMLCYRKRNLNSVICIVWD